MRVAFTVNFSYASFIGDDVGAKEKQMKIEDVLRELGDAKKVKVAITDIDGVLRGKYINVDKFKSALKGGFGFCDVVR